MTTGGEAEHKYRMTISRLTIEKLGIKLYDKVAAVLAELVANCYDADAEHVVITLPFDTYLARKSEGKLTDLGHEIKIQDDGHGMTANDVNDYYLHVGINRRTDRGELSPEKLRHVMGRKGIGKLAPFGICRQIEVITAGGDLGPKGYTVSDLILDFDDVVSETDDDYFPDIGPLDGSYSSTRGTTIILRSFDYRRVPSRENLHRQLAARFGIVRPDWEVKVIDSQNHEEPFVLGELAVQELQGTKIDLSDKPVELPDGRFLTVSGWVSYAKAPYKDEAMAGIRIYARGKLVSQTRDFGIESGFTGEYKMRSYLVGVIHADWLDSEEEDLIRSDRQDIIWNSEKGEAFKTWGQKLIREIAGTAEVSIRAQVWEEFLAASNLQERLMRISPSDARFRDSVTRAARLLVGRQDREAIRDSNYMERIVQLAFNLGPHQDLLATLDEIASGSPETMAGIVALFEKAQVVEIYSLGQVAEERVRAVKELERLIGSATTTEPELQSLLESAPWLIYPDWTPLSMNETLSRFREAFESWYRREYGHVIMTTTVGNPGKRPDFVMLNFEGCLELIEIKRPTHPLTDEEYFRAFGYLEAVEKFKNDNPAVGAAFPKVKLKLVCDELGLQNPIYRHQLTTDDRVARKTWYELLNGTKCAHDDFLKVVRAMQGVEIAADSHADETDEEQS
jgi:hypothetical protein